MSGAVRAVVWKEVREIRRDPVTIFVAALLPLVMLFLFGYALSLDVKNAPYAVYDLDRSAHSRDLADAFARSGYFRRAHAIVSDAEVGRLLDRGQARLVLVIPADFSERIARGDTAHVQTLIDGSFSATAMVIAGYAAAIVQDFSMRHVCAAAAGTLAPTIRMQGRV